MSRPTSDALFQLTRHIDINSDDVGQAHSLDHIMVQEFVEHRLEMRLYYIESRFEFCMFTRFNRVKPNHEFGDFVHMSKKQAVDKHQGARNRPNIPLQEKSYGASEIFQRPRKTTV